MKYWLFLLKIATAKYDYRWEYARCQNETIRAENTREKFFVQPSFPNVNNAEFDCIWRLQAPDGYRIKITWPVFHLDSCKVTELSKRIYRSNFVCGLNISILGPWNWSG